MARRRKGQAVSGWLIVDKPAGMTSTDVVNRTRRLLDAQKAGHGGTLDPLATGVLPIAFGEATKTVSYVMEGDKTYRFTVRWGQATDTDDREGKIVAESAKRPTRAEIEAVLPRFEGEIEQVPPAFSAIKVAGERAYDLAREGAEVQLQPRRVFIEWMELTECPDSDHAERAPICEVWPAIWARCSAATVMSPRCAVWPSAPSAKRMQFRWTIWRS